MKTNTLITLTKKSATKNSDDLNNYYIFCNKCNTLLGFEFKNIQNEDEDENNKNEYNYYLLKKKYKRKK